MNELQVIEQREVLGKEFRIYGTVENPLFLAKDVAEWIDYAKTGKGSYDVSNMLRTVDEDEITIRKIFASGQNRNMKMLTEDGLYEVLMQSTKPIAKEFKKQVKTILKDIRRHGMYATDELVNNPDLLIQVATQLKQEREERRKLESENFVKDQLIGELKPKADYTDQILTSKSLVTITQIAKDYGMSGTKMNQLLHEFGVQFKQSGQWLLYSSHHDKGYTHSETVQYLDHLGFTQTKINTKWTQKGRLFIYELLKEQGILPVIER